jgi:hypothetical protein
MLEGCAVVVDTPLTSILWCWGDIRFLRPEQFVGPVPFHASMMDIPQTASNDLIAGTKLLLNTFFFCSFLIFHLSYVCITSVAVGVNHACAINNVVGGVYCWGTNVFCQLGYPTSSCLLSTSNPRQENPVRAQAQLAEKFAAVTVSNTFTCAITIGRALYCWGDNRFGFLGNSSAALAVVPTPVLVNLNAVPHPTSSLITSPFVHVNPISHRPLPPAFSLCHRFLRVLSRVDPPRVRWLTQFLRSCTVGDTVSVNEMLYENSCIVPMLNSLSFHYGPGLYGAVGIGMPVQPRIREPAIVAQVAAVGSVIVRFVAISNRLRAQT